MAAEVQEIREQLAEIDPFQLLSEPELTRAATSCTVHYQRADAEVLRIGEANDGVFIVAKGSAELRTETGVLTERLGEGDLAGVVSTISGEPVSNRCVLIEDSILYRLEGVILRELRNSNHDLDQYLLRLFAGRVAPASGGDPERWPLLIQCRRLIQKTPVTTTPSTSVADAARLMTNEGTASVAVVDEAGQLVGIVTDRDFRSRVIAAGLDGSTLIADVMTVDPITIDAEQTAHDAQLAMTANNIHHLPVLDRMGTMVGVIHRNDVHRIRSNDPVMVAGEIAKANTPDEIAAITARVPDLVEALVAADAQAEAIGRLVSSVTDAATKRLCLLAEDELGPPPMAYAFVCFGSQSRQEQTACTDQDNAIILESDIPNGDVTDRDIDTASYFERLADVVCDGLATAGYRYCPGDIMASNPLRRVGLATWKQYVTSWVNEPDPEAVLNASVYFDCRHVHGDQALTDSYVEVARSEAKQSQLFLGQMAANAADFRPPLGFFRRFVVEKDGAQKDRFDLKRSGVTPVVEMARAYALQTGVNELNTYDRIRAVGETDAMAPTDAADLVAALEHIAYVRLQHQRRQLEQGLAPDNHVDPTTLSRFERDQLKMAFVTIDRHQDAMRRRFRTGQMG